MWPAWTGSLLPEKRVNHPNRAHVDDAAAVGTIGASLMEHLNQIDGYRKIPVIVCIGTDRSTGDSLGPLTGTALQERLSGYGIPVYGTLEEPVHATNLSEVITTITTNHLGRPVIAIDACLGRSENVGYITVKPGPLKPGTGVNKNLPAVGDVHLIGVVNVGGFMEYFVLQNTRLNLVIRMAATIAGAIGSCLTGTLPVADQTRPASLLALL